jgi:hypothetical protein
MTKWTLLTVLDRQGIQTKVNGRRDGGRSGGIRFGVGSLAHLLKNRFYIGEVTNRGEVHRGEHAPILGRDLFEAVQVKARRRRRCAAGSTQGLCRHSGRSPLRQPRQPHEPDACEQAQRALPLLYVACDFAESQGRSRQHRPRASPREIGPEAKVTAVQGFGGLALASVGGDEVIGWHVFVLVRSTWQRYNCSRLVPEIWDVSQGRHQ